MISSTLIRYVLTAAIRDRFILGFFLLLILSLSLSVFMSSAAIIEQDQFAVVFAGGSLRLIAVFSLVLFIVFHIRRSLETKDVEFLLSRPIGRTSFLLSHAAAFALLALFLSVLITLLLLGFKDFQLNSGFIAWGLGLILETSIMAAASLFFAMVISSAIGAAMACFAFYILGRMMGQLLGIIDSGKTETFQALEIIFQGVSIIIPRFDLIGQSAWLVYGMESLNASALIFAQGVVFIALILMATLIDLQRRQF